MFTVPTLLADQQEGMPSDGALRGQRDRFTTKLAEIARKLRATKESSAESASSPELKAEGKE